MIKHLVFAARQPYLPAWGKVNIHSTIGYIPAEYVPNSERQVSSGAYAYDFYILDGDIPTPGTFSCDDLVSPFVSPYVANANCGPNSFKGLETVNDGGAQYVAVLIPGACSGAVAIAMMPIADLCSCDGENVALIDASAGDVNFSLPSASDFNGRNYRVKKTDSTENVIYVNGVEGALIDGSDDPWMVMGGMTAFTFYSDGTNWFVVSANQP